MTIYEKINFPDAAQIDRIVAKKQFYDNGDLSSADKKLFDNVEKIYWRYALKTETTFIQPFSDEERDYPEIEILEIILRNEKQLNCLVEVVMRSIPYPMLIFFRSGEKVQLWLGKLRQNQTNSGRMTLTETETTEWLAKDDSFWETLSVKKMPTANFCVLYEAWFDAISKNRLAKAGIFGQNLSGDAARETLERLKKIEKEITKLRNQMKTESQFNRKMEINVKLQKLKRELELLKGE